MSKMYFASDGSFGDAEGIEIHDTSDWTDAMWEEIESATDNSRPSLSDHFAKGEHEFNPEFESRCDECSLTQEQLKN
jgi:hypothetical protein